MRRVKAKRRRQRAEWGGVLDDRNIGMLAHTGKLCSCWMCRNRRKNEGHTRQERKFMLREKEYGDERLW